MCWSGVRRGAKNRHAGRDACVILATPAGDLLILIKRTAAPGTTLPRLAVASDDGQRRDAPVSYGRRCGTNGPLCAACTLFLTGKSSPKSAGENSVAGRAGDRQNCMLHSSERRDAVEMTLFDASFDVKALGRSRCPHWRSLAQNQNFR